MKYKCVVTCGDSFFAGDELAIDQFYHSYRSLYSTRIENRIPSNKELDLYSKISQESIFHEYKKECVNLRFTSIIEKEFDIPIYNLSRGGFSNSAIFSRIVDFLSTEILKKYKSDEIYVIVGLTGLERFMIPNSANDRNYDAIPFNFRPDGERGKIYDWYLSNYAVNYICTENLLSILGGINFFKLNNIKHCLVDSYLYTHNLQDGKNIYEKELGIALNFFPSPDLIMENFKKDDELVYHPMGHFSKTIHERLALYLINNVLND